MKKLLTALALVLALTGCASEPKEDDKPQEPTAIQTLDVATFVTELTNTEVGEVRYDLVTETREIEGRFTAEETEFVESVKTALTALTLTEVTEATKFTTAPTFYIDLHAAYASNYARVGIYTVEGGMVVEVRTNEGFKQYSVADTTQVEALYNLFETNYPVKEAE